MCKKSKRLATNKVPIDFIQRIIGLFFEMVILLVANTILFDLNITINVIMHIYLSYH